ncbi:right-handed parallel beta-helix repeat-containing protein [Candidatus Woesearchaeota archaeon]|nr:right-handed parallel beta-helix repeat-containing protein [Candidatus Woesearchaeota archaeon]
MKKRDCCLLVFLILLVFIFGCNQRTQAPINPVSQNTTEMANLPEHCKDGLYNAGEEGLDCGWTCPNKCEFTEKCGDINQDETWRGNIHATCFVKVSKGVTLTIQPGTIVKFHHSRDYKNFDRAGLDTEGGNIKAIGTPEKMIWFTSDAPDPANGDWMTITADHSPGSRFDHVIVEYGELGIQQFDSSVPITNSIIRWINSEGLYQERSTPIVINNTLYGNGYHEMALEQYNKNALIKNNLFRDGNVAIHHEKSTSIIEGNYFKNYPTYVISAGMQSGISVRDNLFENITNQNPEEQPTFVYDGSTGDIANNTVVYDNARMPHFDYEDQQNFKLGYIPGHEDDKYPYVYADTDNTRRVIKKIGKDLSFGWTLTYANGSLWRFSIGGGLVGKELDFIRINPETGAFERFANDEIISARGLAWDGEYFYVNDGSLKEIFKFTLDGNAIKIVEKFDIPDKDQGGTNGLASDGKFLYLISRYGDKIWKLDKHGKIVGDIKFNTQGASIGYADGYFWVYQGCKKGLCKISKDGTLVGEIYPAAKDPWGLAWDGKYLWALYRTSENLEDPKLYQMEILNDSLDSDSANT